MQCDDDAAAETRASLLPEKLGVGLSQQHGLAHLRSEPPAPLPLYGNSLIISFAFATAQDAATSPQSTASSGTPKLSHLSPRFTMAQRTVDGCLNFFGALKNATDIRRRIWIYDGCITAQSGVTCASCQNSLRLRACRWSGLPDLDAKSPAIGLRALHNFDDRKIPSKSPEGVFFMKCRVVRNCRLKHYDVAKV